MSVKMNEVAENVWKRRHFESLINECRRKSRSDQHRSTSVGSAVTSIGMWKALVQ